ncbi:MULTISPECIES: PilN family type IVB pilus formation outer membrane protein [unclassified Herbaspirillum]|uniref:PilN family type IVB pilus formation outer membrane protein n=1 Tax=unclassified Herbaspirillum TaxID=2624150 RepID=UPI0011754C8E|nr:MULTISPECIES: PilN family type IVB pilus formation outer membrane protein [unclassified Herbaspirillum]MBB5390530.1 type IVB pilus formation R64 PilN family outer membrane protein [Herbaspirillum sp. SJZ102]TQK08980.1 type IVB pilus formation R64 PilN family outer membrane protein [Herbaspirillum sp. SJZ130]TQK14333.1 type IVB pilus formation R64 PilN family outer membrane protein [Herbaspirillum sp. SJZ106]TWC66650.1 type IVB pilus formation R64 PilN family outer membrane protein [Herbaspir
MNMSKNTIRTMIRLGVAASVVTALGGCTSVIRGAESANERGMAEAGDRIAAMRAVQAPAVRVHEQGYWVATKSLLLEPKSQDVACDLTLYEASPVTLRQFADKVSRICGVRVHVSADALHTPRNVGADDADKSGKNGPRTINIGPSRAGATAPPPEPKVSLNWQGPLSGLLDSMGSQLDLHWQFRDGAVYVFRNETRTFQIYALPGTDALSSSVATDTSASVGVSGGSQGSASGGGGGGGQQGGVSGQGGSVQSVATTLTSSVMDDVAKAVSGMLTPGQSKFTLSKATASMTVTDAPDVLDRIARYIDHENKLLTKQVMLNVKILNIDFDRTDQYGVDWNLAYKSARAGGELISNNDVLGNSVNVHILKGPFKDSSLLLKALSSQGKVTVVTQPSVTTLNLQAVPMQVSTQTSYVASITNTLVAQTGNSVGIEPGQVTSGFNMMLLPYAMADNQLLLQYNISLSSLDKLETFGDKATGQVQLPTVGLRAFAQKVRLRSGETLALSGFEQSTDTSKRAGMGSPDNFLLGGSRYGQQRHGVTILLITPVVMD